MVGFICCLHILWDTFDTILNGLVARLSISKLTVLVIHYRFSYAETWELLNLSGQNNFSYHICYKNLAFKYSRVKRQTARGKWIEIFFFFHISGYTFLQTLQIYNKNKIKKSNIEENTKTCRSFSFLQKQGIWNTGSKDKSKTFSKR